MQITPSKLVEHEIQFLQPPSLFSQTLISEIAKCFNFQTLLGIHLASALLRLHVSNR